MLPAALARVRARGGGGGGGRGRGGRAAQRRPVTGRRRAGACGAPHPRVPLSAGGAGRRRGAMSRPEAEPCSRALAQARVYLGQLRGRVAPAGPEGGGRRDYLVEAARQLRLALERDVSEDYEEAFNHYQNGVDVLLRGVQVDPNKERREAVKRKITQYLRRAEEIFNCHLQRAAGDGNPTTTGYSSLRFRPIRTLSSAVENLRRCKVVGVIDKVQIVQDPATGGTFILKSLPKSHVETRERQTIIPHGVPFMVKLLCYYVSEDSIFLHLEHVQGHVRLTFFGQWTEVEPQYCSQAREELYSAPEVGGIAEPTEAADCWSFGSLLYELLTGVPLSLNHPSGIQPHTQLHLPEGLSLAATSLLTELLQYNPKWRLGSGGGGMAKLKSHSFFSTVPWNKLVG
ncbi:ribosomal protein S6 kinase-like 1 isoform X3 [Falco cherrug]|uniref:ribosomal protein S6 kinase-like 1 isoform X3 n=2 Tax=Falco TaxID=8952 RepID=UPI00247980EC|nr:ribosomal protein S6 kinase-like 1 isoform X3 [Falco cherrug]XP_055661862.1 ribosomal protein S6 kinase-like 1 isoform X3 [Falco peregrinus]